jgi:hypothetical protein
MKEKKKNFPPSVMLPLVIFYLQSFYLPPFLLSVILPSVIFYLQSFYLRSFSSFSHSTFGLFYLQSFYLQSFPTFSNSTFGYSTFGYSTFCQSFLQILRVQLFRHGYPQMSRLQQTGKPNEGGNRGEGKGEGAIWKKGNRHQPEAAEISSITHTRIKD